MKESLYVVGVGTVIGVCVCLAYLVIDGIISGVKILKYRYKEKHRYDKPPIAKCYCKDCKFHIDSTAFARILQMYIRLMSFSVVWLKERKIKND